jgi:hypothetical protein
LASGILIGLLFLTRGEGILVLLILSAAHLISPIRQRKPLDRSWWLSLLKLMAGFSLPVFAWAIFANISFGSFFPNTLDAKHAQVESGLWMSFSQRLFHDFMPTWGKSLSLGKYPWINLWWLFAAIGLVDVLLRKRKWLLLVAWMVLFTAGYSLLNVSGYWWYALPILFVLNMLFGLGLIKSFELATRVIIPYNVSLGLMAVSVFLVLYFFSRPVLASLVTFSGDGRGASYMALSRWFRENTSPDKSIAYIEIGYLGYYTNNRIVDLAGLLSPDAVPHIAEGDFAWSFWHAEPDYYVYLPEFDWALAAIKADPRFEQNYQPVVSLPSQFADNFIIYHRVQK